MIRFINERRKKILRKRVLKTLQRHKPRKILDNGAGEEGSWNYEKTPGAEITKIDKIFGHDSQNLDFKDNVFDCIVFAGVLQYLEDPGKALDECRRVLKKGGHFIFSTINASSFINALKGFKAENITLTLHGAQTLLEAKGFKLIEKELIDFTFIPRGREMIIYMVCKKK